MDSFPEEDKRWYMRVGYLAENWAALELFLDMIVRTLYVKYGGDRVEPSVPQALNRKLRFARKMFLENKVLNERAPAMGETFDEIQRLADIRNWALHGNRVEADGDLLKLSRFVRGAAPGAMERITMSLDDIYEAACDCASLSVTLYFTGSLAFGLKTQEDVEQFLSKLARQLGTDFPSSDPAG